MKKTVFAIALMTAAAATSPAVFAQTGSIHVGANVQVSKAQEKLYMREIWVSADPTDSSHLLGCGIAFDETKAKWWTIVYLSTDGGKSWQDTLETDESSGDPACGLGRDGLALHAVMGYGKDEKGQQDKKKHLLSVYRSTDGGRTWAQQEGIDYTFQSLDRESIAINTADGKYKDWVYITATSGSKDLAGGWINAFGVWVSRDGGKTFSRHLKRSDAAPHYVFGHWQQRDSFRWHGGYCLWRFEKLRRLYRRRCYTWETKRRSAGGAHDRWRRIAFRRREGR
jgi:hypothetical protein